MFSDPGARADDARREQIRQPHGRRVKSWRDRFVLRLRKAVDRGDAGVAHVGTVDLKKDQSDWPAIENLEFVVSVTRSTMSI